MSRGGEIGIQCPDGGIGIRASLRNWFSQGIGGSSPLLGTLQLKHEFMQIEIKGIKGNPANMLRRAGYVFQRQENEEMSFVRPLAQAGYPRFHMYAQVKGFDLVINIHLDQKKETYGDNTRHHGEYENEGALKTEVERIKNILQ